MIRPAVLLTMLLLFAPLAEAAEGLVAVKSHHSVKETADRLEEALKAKGMTVFGRINHAAGAKLIGKEMRPTELVIFGTPKLGTLLMECGQTVAIDLPMKALIWQDGRGKTWYGYNDPLYLSARHDLGKCQALLYQVRVTLASFAEAATQP